MGINLDSNNENNIKQIEKLMAQLNDGQHDEMVFLCVQDKIDHGEEGAEKVEDTVKEMFYDVIFPTMSQFEKGSEWSLAHPMDENVEATTDASQREKTTQ